MPTQEEIQAFVERTFPKFVADRAAEKSMVFIPGSPGSASNSEIIPATNRLTGSGTFPDIPGVSSKGARYYTPEMRMWRARQPSPLYTSHDQNQVIENRDFQEMLTGRDYITDKPLSAIDRSMASMKSGLFAIPTVISEIHELISGQPLWSGMIQNRINAGETVSISSRMLAGLMDVSFGVLTLPIETFKRGVMTAIDIGNRTGMQEPFSSKMLAESWSGAVPRVNEAREKHPWQMLAIDLGYGAAVGSVESRAGVTMGEFLNISGIKPSAKNLWSAQFGKYLDQLKTAESLGTREEYQAAISGMSKTDLTRAWIAKLVTPQKFVRGNQAVRETFYGESEWGKQVWQEAQRRELNFIAAGQRVTAGAALTSMALTVQPSLLFAGAGWFIAGNIGANLVKSGMLGAFRGFGKYFRGMKSDPIYYDPIVTGASSESVSGGNPKSFLGVNLKFQVQSSNKIPSSNIQSEASEAYAGYLQDYAEKTMKTQWVYNKSETRVAVEKALNRELTELESRNVSAIAKNLGKEVYDPWVGMSTGMYGSEDEIILALSSAAEKQGILNKVNVPKNLEELTNPELYGDIAKSYARRFSGEGIRGLTTDQVLAASKVGKPGAYDEGGIFHITRKMHESLGEIGVAEEVAVRMMNANVRVGVEAGRLGELTPEALSELNITRGQKVPWSYQNEKLGGLLERYLEWTHSWFEKPFRVAAARAQRDSRLIAGGTIEEATIEAQSRIKDYYFDPNERIGFLESKYSRALLPFINWQIEQAAWLLKEPMLNRPAWGLGFTKGYNTYTHSDITEQLYNWWWGNTDNRLTADDTSWMKVPEEKRNYLPSPIFKGYGFSPWTRTGFDPFYYVNDIATGRIRESNSSLYTIGKTSGIGTGLGPVAVGVYNAMTGGEVNPKSGWGLYGAWVPVQKGWKYLGPESLVNRQVWKEILIGIGGFYGMPAYPMNLEPQIPLAPAPYSISTKYQVPSPNFGTKTVGMPRKIAGGRVEKSGPVYLEEGEYVVPAGDSHLRGNDYPNINTQTIDIFGSELPNRTASSGSYKIPSSNNKGIAAVELPHSTEKYNPYAGVSSEYLNEMADYYAMKYRQELLDQVGPEKLNTPGYKSEIRLYELRNMESWLNQPYKPEVRLSMLKSIASGYQHELTQTETKYKPDKITEFTQKAFIYQEEYLEEKRIYDAQKLKIKEDKENLKSYFGAVEKGLEYEQLRIKLGNRSGMSPRTITNRPTYFRDELWQGDIMESEMPEYTPDWWYRPYDTRSIATAREPIPLNESDIPYTRAGRKANIRDLIRFYDLYRGFGAQAEQMGAPEIAESFYGKSAGYGKAAGISDQDISKIIDKMEELAGLSKEIISFLQGTGPEPTPESYSIPQAQ